MSVTACIRVTSAFIANSTIVGILILITPHWVTAQSLDVEKLSATGAAGFQANLDAFDYFTCEYTVTVGDATSLENATAGRFLPGARTAVVSLVKDGNNVCFRLIQDAEATKDLEAPPKAIKEMNLPNVRFGNLVPFTTTDFLANSTRSLAIDPGRGGSRGNIYNTGSNMERNVDSILAAIGVGSDLDVARLAKRQENGLTVTRAEVRGTVKPLIHIEYSSKKNALRACTIDPSRGYLPTIFETTYQNDTSKSITSVPKMISCSKGRWFPEQVVRFFRQSPPPDSGIVRLYNVTKFDADNRPSPEAMTVSVPAGTLINQFEVTKKYFRTKQLERVTPDDLDRIHDLTENLSKPASRTLIDTAIHPPRSTWYWYASGGVITFLVVGYAIRRWLASRRKSDAS